MSAVSMHTGSNIDTEFGTVDMEVGLFKTEQGAVIKILCGFSVKRPGFHYYTVYGTKGCLEKRRDADRTIAYFEDIPNLHGMIDIPINGSSSCTQLGRIRGHGGGVCDDSSIRGRHRGG